MDTFGGFCDCFFDYFLGFVTKFWLSLAQYDSKKHIIVGSLGFPPPPWAVYNRGCERKVETCDVTRDIVSIQSSTVCSLTDGFWFF